MAQKIPSEKMKSTTNRLQAIDLLYMQKEFLSCKLASASDRIFHFFSRLEAQSSGVRAAKALRSIIAKRINSLSELHN